MILLVVRCDSKDITSALISDLRVRILTMSHLLYHEKSDKGHLLLTVEPLWPWVTILMEKRDGAGEDYPSCL